MGRSFCTTVVSVLIASASCARDHVHAVGSSTVFPFVAAAAEQFSRNGVFRTPIVEVNGTGGGFKMFCEGVGERFPDIANASRPIKPSEIERCTANGVTAIAEFTLGYDGIVFANARTAPAVPLTKNAVFLALAKQVPVNGKLVPNPYTRWHEIDRRLPDMPIEIYGPPPAEGTRDALVELVMNEACKTIPEYRERYQDDLERARQCGTFREDGKFIEVLGGNLMVQKLATNSQALGIFSYSFLDQNRAAVKANPVDGVMPEIATIVAHRYTVARSLFLYVKRAQIGRVPGLAEFVQFIFADAVTGPDGFLVIKGLLPLPEATHAAEQKRALVL